jgi:DNA topoisomerase-3
MGLAYVCEKTMARPKACDFRSGRIILQQEILPEQMVKLLNEGRTDLLPGFVSQRTRRPFKAYLARGADGKVSFGFEERKPKAGKEGADSGKAGAKPAAKKIAPAATVKKTVSSKAPAKKVAAKKSAVKKTAAKKAGAAKAVAKKVAAKKAVAKKAA